MEEVEEEVREAGMDLLKKEELPPNSKRIMEEQIHYADRWLWTRVRREEGINLMLAFARKDFPLDAKFKAWRAEPEYNNIFVHHQGSSPSALSFV